MNAAKREQATPNMTVRQLRELKKQPEDPKQITMDELESQATGQTSGQHKTPEMACTINNYWKDLKEDVIKELCLLTGNRFNSKSNYKIEIKAKPKSIRMALLKKELCVAAGIKYDPENYDYGITVERIKK